VRAVEAQRELLEGLRTRAGALLAAGLVATAFLSSQGLGRHQVVEVVRGQRVVQAQPTPLAWLAITLFSAVVVLALVVLTPRRLRFAHHPHELIAHHLEPESPTTIDELYRTLAYWNGVHLDENGRQLEAMIAVFALACASLVAEILVWLVVLGGA
jgi:hypothetical protein